MNKISVNQYFGLFLNRERDHIGQIRGIYNENYNVYMHVPDMKRGAVKS